MELSNTKQSTTTTSKYVRDFELLFVPIKPEQLRDKARSGNLRHCQFRSLCWRYFLHCLPEQYDQWLISCKNSRCNYEKLKLKHSSFKKAIDIDEQFQHQQQTSQSPSPTSNPDSTSVVSNNDDIRSNKTKEFEEEQQYIKAANECDHKNVLRTIERDVVRTFPDMEFFRQTEMQQILERVLFNFASENPHISYKQGMHELLATLLYVLHTDSQNCLINHQGGYANETIATLLDFQYLEHDTFQLFSALMKSIETWYQNDEILVTTSSQQDSASKQKSEFNNSSSNIARSNNFTGSNNNISSVAISRQQVTSVLGSKLKMISENIVKNYDIELFNHLEALQIAPQIYGIRWMRLLFGREFEFLDLLTVWDAIICDQKTMSLTNYIFASMLITIREKLVNGDYTDCLNNLMRHQFKDVQHVIKLALHLRNPKIHPRPKEIHSSQNARKNFSQLLYQNQHNSGGNYNRKNQSSPETSLTSRLSQQYISVKQQLQQANNRYEQWSNSSGSSSHSTLTKMGQRIRQQQQLIQRQPVHPNQQYHNKSSSSSSSTSANHMLIQAENPVKEYEMREMQTSSSSGSIQRGSSRKEKINIGNIYGKNSKSNLANISSESYEDLHSIVDYCWRLLSEQIDSLQRCLPKEKGLHSEDEIFVALAQLKKVRDVLKGSLRLEDELESAGSNLESKK